MRKRTLRRMLDEHQVSLVQAVNDAFALSAQHDVDRYVSIKWSVGGEFLCGRARIIVKAELDT